MNKKYFGTDGIRGRVGTLPISPDEFLKIGWAFGQVLARQNPNSKPKVLIGKDTRISGYMFESALEAGLVAAGVDVYLLGPMPTPGVSYLARTFKAAAIVISASHNNHHDNGIKFFSAEGKKLPDEMELQIEQFLQRELTIVDSGSLGKAVRVNDAQGRYIEFCKSTFPNDLSLTGLKIVVDCANGAAYNVAPNVFQELGAEVVTFAVSPNGLNINQDCGATAPQALAEKVKQVKADVGIALDGDADRVIFVDHTGKVVDGDELLFVIVRWYLHQNRALGGVVGTLMTNYGLEQALTKMGIAFCRSDVGDRYVLEAMLQRGWTLGGESSGHIICLDAHTTGDGIIAALRVLSAMVTFGETLFQQLQYMQKCPQVLINVPIATKINVQHETIRTAVATIENKLGKSGRVLLRASGTEPLVRVMVEGHDQTKIQTYAQELANTVAEFAKQQVGEISA